MRRIRAALALLSIAACGGSTGTAPPPQTPQVAGIVPATDPAPLLFVSQTTTVSARIFGPGGIPLSGVGVSFVPSSGGTVSSSQPPSDADGVATVQWTTAKVVGPQTLVASVPGTIYKTAFNASVSISVAGRWTSAGAPAVDITFIGGANPFNFSGQGTLNLGTPSYAPLFIVGSVSGATFAFGASNVAYNGTIDPTGNVMTGSFIGGGVSQTVVLRRQ